MSDFICPRCGKTSPNSHFCRPCNVVGNSPKDALKVLLAIGLFLGMLAFGAYQIKISGNTQPPFPVTAPAESGNSE